MNTPPVPPIDSKPALSARTVVGFLLFCELASGFVQGFYSPLLGSIADRFQVSDADITWFLTVQTLAAAVCVPLLARLGDVFGHRRILRVSIVAVLVGTLLTALAPNYALMLVGRLLIGPLAVWLPLEIALVHNRISGETARSSIGLLVAILSGGAIIGTLSAGAFASLLPSLTATLLVPAIFVAVAAYAVFFKVPESTERTRVKLDIPGFAGLAIAMLALLVGLSNAEEHGFAAPAALIPLAVAAVVFAAWILWERRAAEPAIDVRMIVSRELGPIYLTGFLFGMILFGTQAPIATFLAADPAETGYGFGAGPGVTSGVIGLLLIVATIGGACFAPIARRVGIRSVLVSGAVLAASGWAFQIAFHTQLWHIFVMAVVSGSGLGLLMGALPALVAELAPRGSTGIAAGVYNSLRTLGGAVAGAVFAVLLTAFTPAGDAAASFGGYLTIWIIAAIAFLVCAVVLATARMPRPHAAAQAAAETHTEVTA